MERLTIPLLANGEYTEWTFAMAAHLRSNMGNPKITLEKQVNGLLGMLVKADRKYGQVFDIFNNQNYLEADHRIKMEEHLSAYNDVLGKFLLNLAWTMQMIDVTPFMLGEYYQQVIKEENLNVLQGAHEPFNLSLQIGHWENYIVSEVGWSLRGAFNIVPPAELTANSQRDYPGNRISNDSIYVMRIKQWDITAKALELPGASSKALVNQKAIELWSAIFNYLNYMGAKPLGLYNTAYNQYQSITNLLEKENESNK